MTRNPVRLATFSADLFAAGGEALPSEFRIFRAGVNESTKGPSLFDSVAAERVMAAFARGGVDLPIDLAHDSLSEQARVARDDADDARGWFRLEVRAGELWAVGVTWTPDGERRLRARTQRYISPAFFTDEGDRVTEIINCALCSMPATLEAVPLVASRIVTLEGNPMDPKNIKEALDAIESGDSAKALEILKSLIASAAGAPEEEPAPEEPAGTDALEDTPDEEPEDPEALRALARAVRTVTGRKGAGEAEAELLKLRARVDAIDAERAALDASARRELVTELVKLGAEVPATAWAGDPEKRVPSKRLEAEPLAELRARVEVLRAARPALDRRALATPDRTVSTLSDVERAVHDRLPNEAAKVAYMARRTARKAG